MLKASLCAVTLAVCPYAMADTGEVQQVQSDIQHWIDRLQDETDKAAPVDYGYGPGVSIPQAQTLSEWNVSAVHIAAAQIPTGGSNAHLAGVFGAPIAWPIIPIHVVLLPDGRVMSYGTHGPDRSPDFRTHRILDTLKQFRSALHRPEFQANRSEPHSDAAHQSGNAGAGTLHALLLRQVRRSFDCAAGYG